MTDKMRRLNAAQSQSQVVNGSQSPGDGKKEACPPGVRDITIVVEPPKSGLQAAYETVTDLITRYGGKWVGQSTGSVDVIASFFGIGPVISLLIFSVLYPERATMFSRADERPTMASERVLLDARCRGNQVSLELDPVEETQLRKACTIEKASFLELEEWFSSSNARLQGRAASAGFEVAPGWTLISATAEGIDSPTRRWRQRFALYAMDEELSEETRNRRRLELLRELDTWLRVTGRVPFDQVYDNPQAFAAQAMTSIDARADECFFLLKSLVARRGVFLEEDFGPNDTFRLVSASFAKPYAPSGS